MSARGGVIRPGEVRPLGVQAERGFIQVVSPLQVKHEIRKAEGGLLKLEPMELPAEFRLLTSSPSLAVYQYTARPFTLEIERSGTSGRDRGPGCGFREVVQPGRPRRGGRDRRAFLREDPRTQRIRAWCCPPA